MITRAVTLAPLFTILFALSPRAQNLGHRMGGDVFKPENTLCCYKKALAKLQKSPEFQYVELDVQESKDGALVVFHDTKSIKRLVPKSKANLAALAPLLKTKEFNRVRIADLTLAQIEKLVLEQKARIPTLDKVLDASVRWRLRKPLLIEIKSLRSDACREAMLELVAPYRKKLDVDFLAFPAAFRASFPDPVRWKLAFKRHDFKVYTAMKAKTDEFDLAADTPAPEPGRRFRTVLAETEFVISLTHGRSVRYPVSLPTITGSGLKLRVGIEHGYDDTGDRGARFRVLGEAGKPLTDGFSKSRGWIWFEHPLESVAELTLVVDDLDTNLNGKHPGNAGRVKVTLSDVQTGESGR